MIGNKLELSIVGVFQDDLSTTHSINQVSKVLKKSYPLINRKSNLFLQEGILKKINVGKSYQCFLDLNNDKARALMVLNEAGRKELFARKNRDSDLLLQEVLQISRKHSIESVVLYKNSIIFITSKTSLRDEIMHSSLLTRNYTLLFLEREKFAQHFIDDRDLQKYHIILYNIDVFVNILSLISDKLIVNKLLGHAGDKQ